MNKIWQDEAWEDFEYCTKQDSKIEVCEHNLICEHSLTVSVHKFYALVNTKLLFVFTVFGIIPSPYIKK